MSDGRSSEIWVGRLHDDMNQCMEAKGDKSGIHTGRGGGSPIRGMWTRWLEFWTSSRTLQESLGPYLPS